MKAVAISSTTGISALLFSRVSGREVTRAGIGVARIDRSNIRQQKHREESEDQGKRPLAAFHL